MALSALLTRDIENVLKAIQKAEETVYQRNGLYLTIDTDAWDWVVEMAALLRQSAKESRGAEPRQ